MPLGLVRFIDAPDRLAVDAYDDAKEVRKIQVILNGLNIAPCVSGYEISYDRFKEYNEREGASIADVTIRVIAAVVFEESDGETAD